MGAMNWNDVRERVEALARADKTRKVFGAWDKYGGAGHHFGLADPLSEADVAQAEAQWGVSLPVDYRAYLIEVGAGGAGPGYGLTILGHAETGWLWSDPGGGTVHERLRFPFPGGEESARVQAEHERKEPVESDFEGEAAFREAYRAWLVEDERLFDWFSSGAVCLATRVAAISTGWSCLARSRGRCGLTSVRGTEGSVPSERSDSLIGTSTGSRSLRLSCGVLARRWRCGKMPLCAPRSLRRLSELRRPLGGALVSRNG